MGKLVLNVTNGDYFNEFFAKTNNEIAIPFREVMMDGEALRNIFSDEFISLRAKELGVSSSEYADKMSVCNELKNDYRELKLWFGKDAFCQINLLVLLAYLEQINYDGKITLNIIDDETYEVIKENIAVSLGDYCRAYESVLIQKELPSSLGVIDENAVKLYFDYHDKNGKLVFLIKDNDSLDKEKLIRLLIKESKDYGLSSEQIEKLIEKNL